MEYFGIDRKFVDEISIENITSQNFTDDSGIPDIAIETDNFICYIENKIRQSTGLQENQKSNYPEKLLKYKKESGKHIAYIFLIPESYIHKEEIDEVKNKYKEFTRIYYWHEFLSYLYRKELHIESPVIKEGLYYFSKVVSKIEAVDTALTPREVVIMYNQKTITGVLSLFNKTREIVKNSLDIVVKRMAGYSLGTPQNDQWGQGYYLKYKDKQIIWVGLVPNIENEKCLFSVAFNEHYLKKDIKIDSDNYSQEGWWYIGINRALFVEDDKEEKLAAEIIRLLDNVFIKNYKE